jgi:hypothetical protein
MTHTSPKPTAIDSRLKPKFVADRGRDGAAPSRARSAGLGDKVGHLRLNRWPARGHQQC